MRIISNSGLEDVNYDNVTLESYGSEEIGYNLIAKLPNGSVITMSHYGSKDDVKVTLEAVRKAYSNCAKFILLK